MIKITVDSFKGLDFVDLYVYDENNKELEIAQGINSSELNTTLKYYLIIYKTNEAMVTYNVYDDEEYLQTSITEPVTDFLQGSDY